MQTERLIYLVTEYASGGEIFGKFCTFPEQILIGLHTSVDCFNAQFMMLHTHTHTHLTALFPGLPR